MSWSGWIGVDFDGTLAEYHGWNGGALGAPIPPMVERVRRWLNDGQEVRIFTARLGNGGEEAETQRALIELWCIEHLGQALQVTATKDFRMIALYDDRCVQIETNTGRILGRAHEE